MQKNITFLILFLSVVLAMLVYGCSNSGGSVFVNNNEEGVITSKEVVFDEQGRTPTATLPSGVRIEATEENTLDSGIIMSLVEKKIKRNQQNNAYFDNFSNIDGFLYEISAFKKPSSSLDKKAYVTSLEKPVKITIPKSIVSKGVTFIGIKESETDPWRFSSITSLSEILANIAEVRASEASQPDYTFNLFRLGVQFALINFEGDSGNKLPETIVSSLVASSTSSINVKNGKYLEDIPVKGILKGVNLDSIKPTDLKARITYRSNSDDEARIKINGTKVAQTSKADKTVSGYSYCHSFIVENVVDSSLMSNDGEFLFTINLKDVETTSFPSGFLIEFYNKIDDEKILPYIYAEFYKLNLLEKIKLELTSDNNNIVDEDENLFCWKPSFTVSSNFEFSDVDKEKIASAISVSNVESEKISKTWNGKTLTLSFDESLLPNMDYTISMSEVSDLEKASIIPFDDFSFATIYNMCGYLVVHQQQNIVDDEYTVFEEENKTAKENAEVTPDVKTYEGFYSPEVQTITVASGSENRIVYSYNRKVSEVIIHKGIGIATVSGEGSYKYGATVVASCTMNKDYAFDKWTDLDGKEMSETFTMPDKNVEMTAYAVIDGYAVIINKGRGIADVSGDGLHVDGSTVTASCTVLDGYVFDKWTDSEGNEVSGTFTMPADNVIMTANAKAVTYEIVYNLAGGNSEGNNPTRYTVETETFSITNPTNDGFAFIGWTGTDLDSASTTLSIVQGSTGNREYTANWGTKSYYLSINKTSGINTVTGDGTHEYNSEVTASCTMLDGYEFDCWTGDFTTETFTMQASNATMTANAKPISYNITYNYMGGTVTTENPKNYDITSATIILNNPSIYGYTFAGWTGTGLDSASMTLSIAQGSKGDKEFTANFTPISYTISYILNGGSFAVENPDCYDITSATITLNNPTKEGYSFTGWTGTDLVSASTTLFIVQGSSGNREYTANWSKNSYYLSINKTSGIDTVTGEGLYEYNSEVTASCTLLNGYEFVSWTGDFTTETFAMPASNATMTANAKPISYSISYDSNGGSFESENPESYDITSATITLINPTKADNDFLGWEGTEIPDGTASMTVTIPQGSIGDRSYVASFSPRYSINYNLVNGTVAEPNPQSYNFFTPTITLNNPTKDGYDFLGWEGTEIPDGTASMTVTIPQGSEGTRSYTASFTQKFAITYDLDGGSLETENPEFYNEYTNTFVLNNPTKDGYDFIGWIGTDIPEDTTYFEVTILKGSTGPRNYVASYTQKYTITYNLNNGSLIRPNPNSYNVYTDDFTLHNPVRPNYAFAGWTEGTATISQRIVKIPQGSTGNKVFTANWHEKLTFTLPGGIPLVVNKCPAGTFTMGSPDGELGKGSNEKSHKVKISKDFYLGKFEVTQEQYQAVMENNPSYFNSFDDSATRPVENLKCSKAIAFCASLTEYLRNNGSISDNDYFDLPTEAQWEYACRAGTISALNSGKELTSETGTCRNLDELGWYDKNANNETHPVGEKLPNNWEFYDMHGNAHEFCKDLRPNTYPDYTVDDPEVEVIDPYITVGNENVIRGGCFITGQNGNAKRCRSASRQGMSKESANKTTGFRVIFVKE